MSGCQDTDYTASATRTRTGTRTTGMTAIALHVLRAVELKCVGNVKRDLHDALFHYNKKKLLLADFGFSPIWCSQTITEQLDIKVYFPGTTNKEPMRYVLLDMI